VIHKLAGKFQIQTINIYSRSGICVDQLSEELQKKLGIHVMRVVGDRDMK